MRRTLVCLLLATSFSTAAAEPERYFGIHVVDDATGRGVPMVELTTTAAVRYVTDSRGWVAFRESGLMNTKVFFHVKCHGYEMPKDGFGFRGRALVTKPGARAEIRLGRINVAERIYRVTGLGIYRDSLLLGEPAPLIEPLLSGRVTGQDSVVSVPYRGRLFWIWGDTNRPAYPLGNFGASAAWSDVPEKGGLHPSIGVDLEYVEGEDGFSRPVVDVEGPGPKWLSALMVVSDAEGAERLFAYFARMKSLGEKLEHGIVRWDDEREMFEPVASYALDEDVFPRGHGVPVTIRGRRYLYFGNPFPCVRVPADASVVADRGAYEAFTCLAAGTRHAGADSKIDRRTSGAPRYAWRRDTSPIDAAREAELIDAKMIERGQAWIHLTDIETGRPVRAHAGTVRWNEHRQRWVAIAQQAFGTSLAGELWYAEADTILGPWVFARKIVTHDKMTFYNPAHHPWFDEDGGRFIYFEGTYTHTFSGNPDRTPRYDYNQVMYRLDLDDDRVCLPVPIYRYTVGDQTRFGTGTKVSADDAWARVAATPFFAYDRPLPGTVPVREGPLGLHLMQRAARVGDLPLVAVYATRRSLALEPPTPGAEPIGYAFASPAPQFVLEPEARPAPWAGR